MQITEQKELYTISPVIEKHSAGSNDAWLGDALRRLLLFPALHIFAPMKVVGLENLQGDGPYIFAANHTSHLDAPLLLAALPPRLRMRIRVAAAADYFFSRRWKAALVTTALNAFAFERKGSGCLDSLALCEQLVRTGHSLLIFPEGTRAQDGQLQHFKWGVGKLALATAAQVVPVWIEDAYAVLPKGARWPRRHAVTVHFGAPLRFTDHSAPEEIAAEIEQRVRALAQEQETGPCHPERSEGSAARQIGSFAALRMTWLNLADRFHHEGRTMETKHYGGIYAIKPWWQRQLHSLEDWLVSRRVHPNLITLGGMICAALLGLALYLTAWWPALALLVAPLAIGRLAANALDGTVARRTGLASQVGEVFNEVGDRLSDSLVCIGLALNGHVLAPLAWLALVLMLLTSYVGIAAKAAGGQRLFGGLMAKADRMIALALFSPLVLCFGAAAWNWLLLLWIPALVLTMAQRCRRVYRDLVKK
jgi:1-acyl-sn-glycerol-3-phosphate acyltransferase